MKNQSWLNLKFIIKKTKKQTWLWIYKAVDKKTFYTNLKTKSEKVQKLFN